MSSPLQQTAQWFADRCGCLTASRAAAVLQRRKDGKPTAAYEALIDTLICERVTNQPEGIGNPPSIQWGRDHEDEARDAYEDATGELVDLVGFIPHPTIKFFGASPDGLVGEDGLLEIKCPYSTNVHLQRVAAGIVPEEYKPQMLVQLLCTGRKWVDFVSYDPRLSGAWSPAKLFIARYEPTQDELNTALEQCETLLAEVKTRFDALARAVIKEKAPQPNLARTRPDAPNEAWVKAYAQGTN